MNSGCDQIHNMKNQTETKIWGNIVGLSNIKDSNRKNGKTKRKKCPHCGAKLGRYPTKCYKCGNELDSIGSWQPYEISFGKATKPSGYRVKKIAAIFIVILIVI